MCCTVKDESATTLTGPQSSSCPLERSTLIDETHRYCEPCLTKFKAGLASYVSQSNFTKDGKKAPLVKITKYSNATATSAMIRHLLDVHNINISSVGRGAAAAAAVKDRTEQIKLCFGGSRGSSSARISPHLSVTLNEDLTMWLAADTLPFSTVDTPAFHTLFQRHVPNAKLPSSDTQRRTTLPKVYGDMKLRVSSCLQSVPSICLMFDGWSDRHNARHFLGIRAAVILDDWSSKSLRCHARNARKIQMESTNT